MDIIIGGNPSTSIVEDINKINEDRFFQQSIEVEADSIFDSDPLEPIDTAVTKVPTQDIIKTISTDNNLSRLLNSNVVDKINGKATDILNESNELFGGSLSLKNSLSKIDLDACDFSLSDLALDFGEFDLNLQIAGIMQMLSALFCIDIPNAFSQLKDFLSGDTIDDTVFGKAVSSMFSKINPDNGLAAINDIISNTDSELPISVFNPNIGNEALSLLNNDKSGYNDPVSKHMNSIFALDSLDPMWSKDEDGIAPYKLYSSPNVSKLANNSLLESSNVPVLPVDDAEPITIESDLPDNFYMGIAADLNEDEFNQTPSGNINIDNYI